MLVTAGAGSGKTSVLVERILQRIMEPEAPVEIDKLLVVTFTNAAAAEMKQRIGAALEEALHQNPRLTFLRRQLLLLNKAAISTVHSFCLQVIKRYYYLRDLDPSFRILEETEADLLQQEVLEEVLEGYYAKEEADSSFYRLVDVYSSDRGDEKLSALVLRLYSFSRSHLQPDLWLQEQAAAFALKDAGELEQSPWVREMLLYCRQELAGMRGYLEEALELAKKPEGPEPYIATLQEELTLFQQLEEAAGNSWADLSRAVQFPIFGRLKPCRGKKYNLHLRDSAKQRRQACKDALESLREIPFRRPLEELAAELGSLAPLFQFLVGIVQDFARSFRQAKEERGALDFADLEHFALEILSHPDAGNAAGEPMPSAAALQYREQFVEVLIDEYQDINPVQEAILALVSLAGPETAGNRFMVGDVKQSIYRFRLAAPELFLEKYRSYTDGVLPGKCLALAHNFRSRQEILEGVNFLFRQIMDEAVGEMEYEREVWLRYGAAYPESHPGKGPRLAGGEEKKLGSAADPHAVEVLFITRSPAATGEAAAGEADEGENAVLSGTYGDGGSGDLQTDEESAAELGEEELDSAALEGRLIAGRIKELLGKGGKEPFKIFDQKSRGMRPARYRDIVILLRAARNWAIPILEELRRAGIPAYAELGTGYFEATEIEVMLSLLKIIDNPYQEIPLAAVLRSPLVGLNAGELARIRAAAPAANYYEALKAFCNNGFNDDCDYDSNPGCVPNHDPSSEHAFEPSSLPARLSFFRQNLQRWQEEARQGSLAGLIWQIYRDTGYYDLVGGMPGGSQRQANLRALYDRARQYEATSLRGLFRFLRFIERLKERGGDLGVARALGEQEDVVRIITVHKSKGLEFPIVFVAGLAKQFNRQDLRRDFLLHKKLGFGPKYVHTALRLIYPTLPWLVIRNKLNLELLAEEMRILYVALTRAREKLFLVATVKDMAKEVQGWGALSASKGMLFPAFYRRRAKNFLDWLGPALLRHPRAAALRSMLGESGLGESGGFPLPLLMEKEPSVWKVGILTAREVSKETEDEVQENTARDKWAEKVARLEKVPLGRGDWTGAINRNLTWQYPFHAAANLFAKVSVSELQKIFAAGMEKEDAREAAWLEFSLAGGPRPRFLGAGRLTAAERGTAYHTVMQHLEFSPSLDEENIRRQLETLVVRELLSPEEKETVDPASIAAFFHTSLGKRILAATRVRREIPFSLALPAADVYPGQAGGMYPGRVSGAHAGQSGVVDAAEGSEILPPSQEPVSQEPVLIQGVIDCLAWEKDGLLLVDYKTDQTSGLTDEMLRERYRLQLEYYARALQVIWQEKITGKYLYFFHGSRVIAVF